MNLFKRTGGGRKNVRLMAGKFAVVGAALAIASGAVAGCATKASESTSNNEAATKVSAAFPLTVKDDGGHTLTLKQKPARVVSLAPTDTEMLFAVGAGGQVVGVSKYCDYPPEAKRKEVVGDFSSPNLERIVALKPEIVFAAAGVQNQINKRLSDAGIQVFVVDPKSIEGILDVIDRVGRVTGNAEKAKTVISGLRKRVDGIKNKVAGSENKPKVFFEVYSQPLMTAGGPTVVNDMIKTAGGVNIAADINKDFPQYSLETLIEKNPDVYVATSGAMANPGEIKNRPGWDRLSAIRNKKVFVLDENLVNRYGPRLIDGLELMAKAIHPEAFK
ncbi:MAG: cobalamin-binding protein [Chloroflexi bacterium]|nr:cobalamin-binding protein [Chloroflexota bacterium]